MEFSKKITCSHSMLKVNQQKHIRNTLRILLFLLCWFCGRTWTFRRKEKKQIIRLNKSQEKINRFTWKQKTYSFQTFCSNGWPCETSVFWDPFPHVDTQNGGPFDKCSASKHKAGIVCKVRRVQTFSSQPAPGVANGQHFWKRQFLFL